MAAVAAAGLAPPVRGAGAGASADRDALALDPQRLGDLKGLATRDDDKALRKVAQEFESLLLQQLLKSMRAATPGDEMTDSEATRTFTGMLDEQYAQTLSRGPGLGLADMIFNQVRAGREAAVKNPPSAAVNG